MLGNYKGARDHLVSKFLFTLKVRLLFFNVVVIFTVVIRL